MSAPQHPPTAGTAARRRRRGDEAAGEAPAPTAVRRAPLLIALMVFVLGAAAVDRMASGDDAAAAGEVPTLAGVSTVAAPGDSGAVWYCATGTARGFPALPAGTTPAPPEDLIAEHVVVLTNLSDQPRRARVTVYRGQAVRADGRVGQDQPDAPASVRRDVEVPARDTLEVPLADVARSTFASAVVEVDGAMVAVSQRVQGVAVTTTAPCTSRPARSWYFAAGTTSGTTRQLIALFNPFPQQVVVDVSFQVDEGTRQSTRKPRRLEGLVVPAERTLIVDATEEVPARRQVSTRVEARDPTARLIAERLLTSPGSAFELPLLSVSPGASAARSVWVFPDGRPRRKDLETTYVLFNPGAEAVDVELRIRPDGAGGPVEPFRATVRPGQYQELALDDRVGASAGYWAAAVARGGGTFVVERVVRAAPVARPATEPGVPPLPPSVLDAGGITVSSGTPVLARDWIVAGASAAPDGGAGLVAVSNLGRRSVTLSITASGRGGDAPVPGYTNVTLDAGARTTLDLTDPSVPAVGDRRALLVRADGPVAVHTALAGPGQAVVDMLAVAVRDSAESAPVEITALAVPPGAGPASGGGPGTGPDPGPSTTR